MKQQTENQLFSTPPPPSARLRNDSHANEKRLNLCSC